MLTPRAYQQKAVDITAAMIASQPLGRCHPVIEAPTGSGKSLIQAMLLAKYKIRTIAVTHVKELIEQNHEELLRCDHTADAGIYHAGIGLRQTENRITFCGIASVYKRAHEFGRIDLIIIDECHLLPNNQATMYRKFIDDAQRYNPQLVVLGLSATPYRLGNGLLTEGEGALFTDIVPAKACGMSMRELIEMGYLAPVTTAPVKARMTTDGIKKTAGDFNLKELAAANDTDPATRAAVNEIVHFGQARKSWLIFAINVDHAHHIAELMPVETAVVTGTTPKTERENITRDFKAGRIKCLVNVNVLTTGFNAPGVDLVAFLRPTHSASLY
ncbi:MAG: DEAD/DEAH box helicase, partial [Spongiibacteraceae bacterium]